MSVWKSDETLLSICILNFSFKNDFVWEEISNIRHSVSSPDETPRSSSKILRCASYFQLSSRCFIWWWNTASHVWYITWNTVECLILLLKQNKFWRNYECKNEHFLILFPKKCTVSVCSCNKKCSVCNSWLKLNKANRRLIFFSALALEMEEHIK